MIRIVVLVLLTINLLYLGWSRWIRHGDTPLTAVTTEALAAKSAAPAAPATPPPCSTLGPFSDEMLADQVKGKLQAAGWGVLRRQASETLHEGWWVHVDNADQGEQTRTLNTLRRAGMRDAFAMPDDPKFSVSVGIFSVEARAEDRSSQVQRLKLDALVSERLRDQPAIWFDVPGVARETLSDGRLATAGIELDKLRVEACPPVAPASPAEPAAAIIPAP
jgi:hypothetical protein